jgi:hypothetical protein
MSRGCEICVMDDRSYRQFFNHLPDIKVHDRSALLLIPGIRGGGAHSAYVLYQALGCSWLHGALIAGPSLLSSPRFLLFNCIERFYDTAPWVVLLTHLISSSSTSSSTWVFHSVGLPRTFTDFPLDTRSYRGSGSHIRVSSCNTRHVLPHDASPIHVATMAITQVG